MKTIEEKLEAVRLSYKRELPEKMIQIEKVYMNLLDAKTRNMQNVEEFYGLIHNLIGSGATFGFRELSEVAKALDVKINIYLSTQNLPTEEDIKSYRDDIDALTHAALDTKVFSE